MNDFIIFKLKDIIIEKARNELISNKKRSLVITDHSLQITSALLTQSAHTAFQVSGVWFRLQLFRTITAVAAFPSMYSALSSSASCCRTFLWALLLLVLLE